MDVTHAPDDRAEKVWDSPYDFVNYWTFGIPDLVVGTYDGMEERAAKWDESIYDFSNWLTFGTVEVVDGALFPREPLSKEHLYDVIGLSSLLAPLKGMIVSKGAGKTVGTGEVQILGRENDVFGKQMDEGTGNVYNSKISPEMENKILLGQRKSLNKNELIGGHSPEISNSNPNYAVEEIAINPDGTRKVKFTTQFPDGTLAKIKTSTLFPDSWSDNKIIESIKRVGDTPSIGQRASDGATLHRGIEDGVQIEVIKIGDDVVSGYPTGGGVTSLLSGFN